MRNAFARLPGDASHGPGLTAFPYSPNKSVRVPLHVTTSASRARLLATC